MVTRRDALRRGLVACGAAVAGCASEGSDDGDGRLLADGFEDGLAPWEPQGHADGDGFDWSVGRSDERVHEGRWSLRVVTGGRADGAAWAVRPLDLPPEATGLRMVVLAWSPSESFDPRRHLVVAARTDPPQTAADFPAPGATSTGIDGAPFGGLREPLGRTAGWREYGFEWTPDRLPGRVFVAVGVAAVRATDATNYVDEVVARTV